MDEWRCVDESGDWLGDQTYWTAEIDSFLKQYPEGGVTTYVPILDGDETIALVVWEGWSNAIGEARAHLMTAAPKLLAALKDARTRLINCAAAHGNDDETIAAMLAPIDAAIAAAEGGA